jgi:hypothetical protein
MARAPLPKKLIPGLVANAFDFLTEAVEVFERSPKYSTIHFYAATELFLKARLAREHWSLLFLKVDEANSDKLVQGDFQSVGLKEAYKRIIDIAGDDFPLAAFNAFDNLRRHRNKLVHFFPPADIASQSAPARLQIIKEQCLAWHQLVELLTRHWKSHFAHYSKEIHNAHRLMRRHQSYLSTRFTELTSEIERRVKAGASQHTCPSCRKDSLLADGCSRLQQAECLVCDFSGAVLSITCACRKSLVLIGDGWGLCPQCNKVITPATLADLLHDDTRDRHDEGQTNRATCTWCQHTEAYTVIPFDGSYLCTCCFTQWADKDIGVCDWCNEPCAGDMSDSHFNGCPHCDGYIGHVTSKDD